MAQGDEGGSALPRVVVLMATYNGRAWIDEQVDSILDQQGVDVRLVVSDDGSSDGTRAHLVEREREDARIHVLPPREGPPGVSANFLHLFCAWPVTTDTCVSFSDQDDVWHPDKLRRQVGLLTTTGADAVSSNVTSFDAEGRRHTIVKDQRQTEWDHLFEAAGPGSTYVFTPDMHRRLVDALRTLDTTSIGVHDWFLYALVRALGGRWVIDGEPTLDYRQHAGNVQGEHAGAAAFRSRLSHLRSGFYREQFLLTAEAVRRVGAPLHDAPWREDLDHMIALLRDRGPRGRLGIWQRRREIRRDPREGCQLALACLLGIW